MRIALIIERFDPGGDGVEGVAWNVARGLVEAGEEVHVFAKAHDALADPMTREQLGAAARRRAEALGWPEHVRALRGLYERVRR